MLPKLLHRVIHAMRHRGGLSRRRIQFILRSVYPVSRSTVNRIGALRRVPVRLEPRPRQKFFTAARLQRLKDALHYGIVTVRLVTVQKSKNVTT